MKYHQNQRKMDGFMYNPANQTQQTVGESVKDNNKEIRGLHEPQSTQQSIKQRSNVKL